MTRRWWVNQYFLHSSPETCKHAAGEALAVVAADDHDAVVKERDQAYDAAELQRRECETCRELLHAEMLRGEAIERENVRLKEALGSIAKNTCCDTCQEAALIAKQALQRGNHDQ